MNRWRLDGKRALVTGASKGIGRATAGELLRLGATVVAVARGEHDLKIAVDCWRSEGLDACYVSGDVTRPEDLERILEFTTQTLDGLDILVANVGTNIRKATLDYNEQEYDYLLRTNLQAAFQLTRAAYPMLKKSAPASIVLTGSVAGEIAIGTGSPYAASKAALAHLTRYLAVEWGRDQIRVNMVSPWYTETPLTEALLSKPDFKNRVRELTPLGRIALAEDISGIIAFLCTPAASYITGQNIAVDGGFLARGGFWMPDELR